MGALTERQSASSSRLGINALAGMRRNRQPEVAVERCRRSISPYQDLDHSMTLRLATWAAIAALLPCLAQAATVWKCKEGDRVIFSDGPFPSTGAPMQARRLQGNAVQSHPVPPKGRPDNEPQGSGLGTFSASNNAPRLPRAERLPDRAGHQEHGSLCQLGNA